MIIYVEGPSCSGKTFLMSALKNKYPKMTNIDELPEYILIEWWDISELCRNNDLYKVETAKTVDSEWWFAIVDRCYASSLCYHYTRWKVGEMNHYAETLSRFFKNKFMWYLSAPDLYLYITASEEVLDERLQNTNRKDRFRPMMDVWLYYKYFFQYIDFDVPVLPLNWEVSTKENIKILSSYLEKSFNVKLTDYA